MKTNEILNESINDKGLFKCLFVIGLPGSGKSYTISNIKGPISPKIVNTDIATEFLSVKSKIDISDENWYQFMDIARRITKNQLYGYVNSMVPLIVESTSVFASNILSRMGILESIGYDISFLFINSDVETAFNNIKEREKNLGRKVSEKFFNEAVKNMNDSKNYFKSRVTNFYEIDLVNEFNDETMIKVYKKSQSFFKSKLENPMGISNISFLKNQDEKYLVPTVFSENQLKKKIDNWYIN